MANAHFFLQPASFKDIKILHHQLCIIVPGTFKFLPPKVHTANCFPDQMLKAKAETSVNKEPDWETQQF